MVGGVGVRVKKRDEQGSCSGRWVQIRVGEGLRSTDTDTATGIRHGETQGHDKFLKIRIRIRQGHDIIR